MDSDEDRTNTLHVTSAVTNQPPNIKPHYITFCKFRYYQLYPNPSNLWMMLKMGKLGQRYIFKQL